MDIVLVKYREVSKNTFKPVELIPVKEIIPGKLNIDDKYKVKNLTPIKG